MVRRGRLLSLCFGLCLGAFAATTEAQDKADEGFSLDEPKESASAQPAAEEPEKEAVLLSDEQALEEERAPHEQYRKSTDPYEDPDKGYFFAGADWRYTRMPSWILETGLESAPSLGSAASFFGEFAWRKDGFQVAADVGWMGFKFKGPFQLAGDPETDTEWLKSNMKLLALSSTITWSTPFADWFSLDYGVEAGLAFVFGDLIRSEAYKKNGKWAGCPGYAGGPNLPNPTPEQTIYCEPPIPEEDTNGDGKVGEGDTPPALTNSADKVGAQYGVKAPHGLFNKGVPHALPILGPRVSLRFKPIHQLVLRVDLPLPVFPFGFFVGGLAAQYGF